MHSARHTTFRRHLLGGICLALIGCGGGGDDGAEPLEAVRADAGHTRWISVPVGTVLIKSQSVWAQTWQNHQEWSASQPPTLAPAVDFGRHAIAGLSIGDPACRSIVLKQLLRQGRTVTIRYGLAYSGGSGCLQFPGDGAAFFLVPADTSEVRAELAQ